MSADALEQLVTRDAGLLAVSAIGQDMRDLLSPQAAPEAREAVDLYCYIARKHMGALAAVLNGLDTLVFTGGIGEHAPAIRQRAYRGTALIELGYNPWGYAWVFPKAEVLSIGIVLPPDQAGSMKDRVRAYIDSLGLSGAEVDIARGHKIRFRRGNEPTTL